MPAQAMDEWRGLVDAAASSSPGPEIQATMTTVAAASRTPLDSTGGIAGRHSTIAPQSLLAMSARDWDRGA